VALRIVLTWWVWRKYWQKSMGRRDIAARWNSYAIRAYGGVYLEAHFDGGTKSMASTRPDIDSISSGQDLRKWYWRKDELAAHARNLGLSPSGAKFDILDRIAHFLDTGENLRPKAPGPKPTSGFDWHRGALTPATVITDSYKNTQNVRRFFKAQCGDSFKFNIAFMEWMKSNVGKTLEEACAAYWEIKARASQPGHETQIKRHNQFKSYFEIL